LHPRVLAVLLPVTIVVMACSSAAGGPPRTYTPTVSAVASASVAPSAVALTGEVLVTMTDAMTFAPDPIRVKAGVPITFIVTNAGLIVHEFVIGTEAEQADHAAEMTTGGMGHGHDNAISVEPGGTGSLTMTFAAAGSIVVGCHEPGHYDAGMKATLDVVD
jgi:uncharacterized cupredoxin-like copper-binding protein